MGIQSIYKLLQQWFPELAYRDLPSKEQRTQYETFRQWLYVTVEPHTFRSYLMPMHSQQYLQNGLNHCAVLQDLAVDIVMTQQQISVRCQPIFAHYEKYKKVIGSHCDLYSQINDIVIDEIFILLKRLNFAMLLIYGGQNCWLAVPNDEVQIDQFCRLFNQHFKDQNQNIEHYQPRHWSWST